MVGGRDETPSLAPEALLAGANIDGNPMVDNITAVFVAQHTDPGGLSGSHQVVLRQTG